MSTKPKPTIRLPTPELEDYLREDSPLELAYRQIDRATRTRILLDESKDIGRRMDYASPAPSSDLSPVEMAGHLAAQAEKLCQLIRGRMAGLETFSSCVTVGEQLLCLLEEAKIGKGSETEVVEKAIVEYDAALARYRRHMCGDADSDPKIHNIELRINAAQYAEIVSMFANKKVAARKKAKKAEKTAVTKVVAETVAETVTEHAKPVGVNAKGGAVMAKKVPKRK